MASRNLSCNLNNSPQKPDFSRREILEVTGALGVATALKQREKNETN